MAPRRNWIQYGSALVRTRPFSIRAIKQAASTVDAIGAVPPLSATPPTIGMANDGRSQSDPIDGCAEPRRAMSRMAAIAESNPDKVCEIRMIGSTWIPDSAADRELPPT